MATQEDNQSLIIIEKKMIQYIGAITSMQLIFDMFRFNLADEKSSQADISSAKT